MVMRTGTMRPSFAWAWVAALNSLQKPMMLTPCWPSAGPTGGDGFALPAGSCSLTNPVIFFAIFTPPVVRTAGNAPPTLSGLLHLHEIELDRRRPPEDGHKHPDTSLIRVHFLDGAVEVGEGSVDDPDVVAFLELHLRLGLERPLGKLGGEPGDLVLAHGRRAGRVPDESGDLGRVLDEVPGPVVQLHLHEDVAREELALRGALLPLHHLHHVLHRDEDVAEVFVEGVLLDLLLERLLRLVLEARVRVHDVPFLLDLLGLLAGHLKGFPHTVGFWILSVRNCHRTSNSPSSAAAIRLATITAMVAARVSARPGQLTLRSSAAISNDTSRYLGVAHK